MWWTMGVALYLQLCDPTLSRLLQVPYQSCLTLSYLIFQLHIDPVPPHFT